MCQCANTTAWCEHHKQRKQKQQNRNNKTQHRIIVYIHPLPFRSIAVCIGVRTLHPSRHLASVLAPCIFLVCLSDDRLRTSSIVRAVTFFVVQGVCCCFTMPGPGVTQDGEKVSMVELDTPKAGIACEGSFRHLEELLTASSCTNSEYQG